MMRTEHDLSGATRGPVLPVTHWKDADHDSPRRRVLAWFRDRVHAAGGGNYQRLINQALRRFVEQGGEPLETVMRRVVREEMRHYRTRGRGRHRGSGG
jgi:hypothetical protein